VPFNPLLIAQSLDLLLAFVGCLLIWRFVLSPKGRAQRGTSPLATWDAPWSDFFVFGLCVFFGYLMLGVAAGLLAKALGIVGDAATIFASAGAQLGMLLGVFAYRFSFFRSQPAPVGATAGVFSSGVATFMMTLPVVMGVSAVWELILRSCGLPVNKQESIEIFLRGESPWLAGTLVVLAVVVAPVTEELAFRAGFYGYLRTRLPRWMALLLPGFVFAIPHVNWSNLVGLASFLPLMALAVVFSLAYERTGRIGTTIVAHALFNLNSILFILAGGGKDM
jgi:membrane protease YdiL (CAAX protease family)